MPPPAINRSQFVVTAGSEERAHQILQMTALDAGRDLRRRGERGHPLGPVRVAESDGLSGATKAAGAIAKSQITLMLF